MFKILIFIVLLLAAFAGFLYLMKRMGTGAQASKYFKAIAILVVLFLLVFLPMFLFSQAITVFEIFKFGVNSFVNSAGVPIWLARAAVALLIVPFLWALGKVFSIRGRSRRVGMAVVAVYVVVYCLAMFQVQKNLYFRHDTGVASKWYCPEDFRTFDTDGFDPNCGTKLMPVTREVAQILAANRNAPPPPASGTQYFNPATGEPMKWYYRTDDGKYELFDRPGFHPRYQVPLKPITPEIVLAIEEQERSLQRLEANRRQEASIDSARTQEERRAAAYRSRYRSPGYGRATGRINLILVVGTSFDASGKSVESAFTDQIRLALEANGYAVHTGVIREPAYVDGIVNRLSGGDRALAAQLDLHASGDYLLLCRRNEEFSEYRQLRDRTTCVSTIEYKLVDTGSGRVLSGSARGSGLGATKEEAALRSADPAGKELAAAVRADLHG